MRRCEGQATRGVDYADIEPFGGIGECSAAE